MAKINQQIPPVFDPTGQLPPGFNPTGAMPPVQKQGKGCFFYGCVTTIIALVLIAIAVYVGIRYALNRAVDTYTVETQANIPESRATAADYGLVRERVRKFIDSIKSGAGPQASLSLSADDINALIKFDPDWAPLKDSVFVTVEGDRIKAQISIDLGEMGFPGRFINGTAVFAARTDHRGPHLFLVESDFNGRKMPEEIAKTIANTDLLEEAASKNKGDFRTAIEAIGTLKIQNGGVFIGTVADKNSAATQEEVTFSEDRQE